MLSLCLQKQTNKKNNILINRDMVTKFDPQEAFGGENG